MSDKKLGIVVAVAVQKGGVGKSTTANGITYHALDKGLKKVLLIDCDPQATQTNIMIGVGSEELANEDNQNSFINLLKNKPVKPITLKTKIYEKKDNIKVGEKHYETQEVEYDFIAAHRRVLGFIEGDELKYNQKIENMINSINKLREEYDLIVLDTPPSFGIVTKAAILASDKIFLPIAPKSVDSDGLNGFFMDLNELLQVKKAERLREILVLPTMFDKRVGDSKEVLQVIKTTVPRLIATYQSTRNIPNKVLTEFPAAAAVQDAPGYNMFLKEYIYELEGKRKDLPLLFEMYIEEILKD